uniref:R13L1/DRL21-like LRR repeat region domain-containing protein n=1 Tax=Lupinus angustifolius TaxID=3871 RepID=L0P2I8_LUPAN|nr:hypothetical protein [Lupinus angustifolius]
MEPPAARAVAYGSRLNPMDGIDSQCVLFYLCNTGKTMRFAFTHDSYLYRSSSFHLLLFLYFYSERTYAHSMLEALHSHSNLKSLELNGTLDTISELDEKSSLFQGLVIVTLEMCFNFQGLSPLGKLSHLSTLQVSGMWEVKYIDDDSYEDV